MKIDKELIFKLEKLARLSLSSEEKEVITKDLENIIDMVNKINEIDTGDVPPLRHMTSQHIDPRDDIHKDFKETDKLINQAPQRKGAFFTIPKVVKK